MGSYGGADSYQAKLHTRSELTITDDSKIGTTLDGQKFFKSSKVLTKDEHTIKLGSYEQVFRVKWRPVVLSFSLTSKDQKNASDPMMPYRTHLEPLGVKAISEYVVGHTTHAVAAKRNTPKGLQALINAKYIVTEAFIDALVRVATPAPNPDDPNVPIPSRLETDFEAAWPREIAFLPEAGKEPTPRPASFFEPNPDRAEVFHGYTFIFCDTTQFENLQGPITNGGGKAFQYELQLGVTTVDEFVQYVKNVAGEKGLGECENDSATGKGVVVVRFRGKKDMEKWAADFGGNVELALDQRSIEQNEFLDAILVNDTSSLRKQLEEEDDEEEETRPRVAPARDDSSRQEAAERHQTYARDQASNLVLQKDASASSNPISSSQPSAAKKKARRTIIQSRFKGFDDFDPSQIPKSNSRGDSPSQISNFSEEQDGMDVESQSRPCTQARGTQASTQRGRKRRAASPLEEIEEIEDDEDVVNNLLPAAAAMKRRRLAESLNSSASAAPAADTQPKSDSAKKASFKNKKEKEVDVIAVMAARREKEEEERRKDEESLQQALEGMDIESMKNLAQVEEMEIAPRTTRPTRSNEPDDSRWDDRWNGRKNFKRFRRQGDHGTTAIRGPRRVIVTLEEVKKKDFGIGEEYWLEPNSSTSKSNRKDKTRSTQSQSQRTHASQPAGAADADADPDEEAARFQRRSDTARSICASRAEDDAAVPDAEDAILPEEIAGTPRSKKLVEATQQISTLIPDTQQSASAARGKRPAPPSSSAKQPPAKKARQSKLAPPVREAEREQSEGEDELKFRFRRRK
ncbi:hypothetical protein LTR04_005917 [Oleoguttula sp. CCFEE 6159]|nr:hypothetical protein LTR04_005917 [Oleoguttula sp. CCFEE 6159]